MTHDIPYHKIFNNSSIFTLQTRITEQQHIYNYLAAEKQTLYEYKHTLNSIGQFTAKCLTRNNVEETAPGGI